MFGNALLFGAGGFLLYNLGKKASQAELAAVPVEGETELVEIVDENGNVVDVVEVDVSQEPVALLDDAGNVIGVEAPGPGIDTEGNIVTENGDIVDPNTGMQMGCTCARAMSGHYMGLYFPSVYGDTMGARRVSKRTIAALRRRIQGGQSIDSAAASLGVGKTTAYAHIKGKYPRYNAADLKRVTKPYRGKGGTSKAVRDLRSGSSAAGAYLGHLGK